MKKVKSILLFSALSMMIQVYGKALGLAQRSYLFQNTTNKLSRKLSKAKSCLKTKHAN